MKAFIHTDCGTILKQRFEFANYTEEGRTKMFTSDIVSILLDSEWAH